MTTIRDVENFLALERIAMVGVSRDPKDFSRQLFREMCSRGYDMVPVNWVANEIDNRESFQCLQAVKPSVEGVLIMTPAHETIRVVRDCAETGIKKVWIYRAGAPGRSVKRRSRSAKRMRYKWLRDIARSCSSGARGSRIACTDSS